MQRLRIMQLCTTRIVYIYKNVSHSILIGSYSIKPSVTEVNEKRTAYEYYILAHEAMSQHGKHIEIVVALHMNDSNMK